MDKRKGAENGQFRGKPARFTQVPNGILTNKKISNGAKGLYATILNYLTIPNFILRKSNLMNLSSDAKYSFNKYWTELKDNGYLFIYSQNTSGGMKWYYELMENPCSDFHCNENRLFYAAEDSSSEFQVDDRTIDYAFVRSRLKYVTDRESLIARELGNESNEIVQTTETLLEAMKSIDDRILIRRINSCTAEDLCRLWRKVYSEVFYTANPTVPNKGILNKTGYVFKMTEHYFKGYEK